MPLTKIVPNRLQDNAELIVGAWICLCQPRRDSIHFSAGLFEAGLRRQPSDDEHVAPTASFRGAGVAGEPDADRLHHIDFVHGTKARRKHADDGEATAIESDRASEALLSPPNFDCHSG